MAELCGWSAAHGQDAQLMRPFQPSDPHPTCHAALKCCRTKVPVWVFALRTPIRILNSPFPSLLTLTSTAQWQKMLRFSSTIKLDFPVCRRGKVKVTVIITAVFLFKAEHFREEFGLTSNQHSVLKSLGLFWSGQRARTWLWTEKVSKVYSNITEQTRWNTKI